MRSLPLLLAGVVSLQTIAPAVAAPHAVIHAKANPAPHRDAALHHAHPNAAGAAPERRVREHAGPAEAPTAIIGITLNGTRLSAADAAQFIDGRVYLPLRAISAALHVQMTTAENITRLNTPAGQKIQLQTNNAVWTLDGVRNTLDGPVRIKKGRTYVPVALFRHAFGAVVRFDKPSANVAMLIRLSERPQAPAVRPPLTGTIANVDVNSVPAVVTLISDDRPQSISIDAQTPVFIEDLVAGTRQSAQIAALHPGDLLTATFDMRGAIAEITDSYRSRNGRVAAVSARAIALEDGQVIMPIRSTTITLNGRAVSLSDLAVGDIVTIRSNPESLEIRDILASRGAAATSATISQVAISPARPLRAREELTVFLRGTPGGTASFDIGATALGVPMTEIEACTYRGRYVVVPGASFLNAPVVAHLKSASGIVSSVSALGGFSAATLPPQVAETAPRDGQTVNDPRASLYATFSTPTGLAIDPASIVLTVNGRDVTAAARRTPNFVAYRPDYDMGNGPIAVVVRAADLAGNAVTYRWSFTIGNAPAGDEE